MIEKTEHSNRIKENFIGRSDPIKIFRSFLFHNSKRILNIHSENQGGIGKTWLVLYFQYICQQEFTEKIIILEDLIDLYDTDYRTPISIMESIAIQFREGSLYFNNFYELMKNYYSATITEKKGFLQKAEETFINDFNDFSEKNQKTILIFIDSYEHMRGTESTYISRWLEKEFIPKCPQPIKFVIAGRNLLSEIDPTIIDIENLNLKPFDPNEIINYWIKHFQADNQEELNHILELSDDQLQFFAKLTMGKPILVALFVDWFNRYDAEFSPKNVMQQLEQKSSSFEEQKAIFEEALVSAFSNLETPKNMTIAYMAFANRRMNSEILYEIFRQSPGITKSNLSINDCRKLLEELTEFSFIKSKKNNIFLLHDEMQRLINQYYWNKPDKDGDMFYRKIIAKILVSYYDKQLEDSYDDSNTPILSAERLHYLLFVDSEFAVDEYIEKMDALFEGYQIYHIQLILQEFLQEKTDQGNLFHKSFQIDTWHQLLIDSYHLKWLNAQYRCEDVLKLYDDIIKNNDKKKNLLEAWSQISHVIYCSIGEAYVWLYQYDKAIEFFKLAVYSLRQMNDPFQEAWMRNWIGYSYQRMGNYDKAFSTIKSAINRMIHERKKRGPLEFVENYTVNLGIMYGNLNLLRFQGGYYEASVYGEIAVSILQHQPDNREQAKMLAALGDSLKFSNKSYHAYSVFKKAKDLTKDPLILARLEIYSSLIYIRHLDYIYLLENFSLIHSREKVLVMFKELPDLKLELAEKALNRSEELLSDSPHLLEKSTLLFYKGLFLTISDDWENAFQCFEECEQKCKTISHRNLMADACLEQMRCLYFSKKLNIVQCHEYDKKLNDIASDFHNIQAKKWNIMGNVYYDNYLISRDIEDFTKAIRYYLFACDSMYKFGIVSKDRFYNALRTFAHRLCQLHIDFVPCKKDLESIRDIWEIEEDGLKVCIRYSHIFNELLDFNILRVQSKNDPIQLKRHKEILYKKVNDWVHFGYEYQRLVPMYAQLLLQISKDLNEQEVMVVDAYHLLGYAHYVNNTMYMAQYFYQKGINLIKPYAQGSLFYVRLLIRRTAPIFRREVFIKIINFSRKDNVKEEFTNFKAFLGESLNQSRKDMEIAENILNQSKNMFIRENSDDFYEVKALFHFRKAEQLIIDTFEDKSSIENHYKKSISAVNKMSKKDDTRYMKAIEGLVTYYYLSNQYEAKLKDIKLYIVTLNELNRHNYRPHIMANLEITLGDYHFDQIFNSPENEEIIQKAFKHYLNAMKYSYDFSEMEIFEYERLLIIRIGEIPKEAARILSQKVYPPLGYLRTAGENADKLYRLIEECLIIHGELL